MEILKLENVCLHYHSKSGETEALKDVSFSVNQGEFIAIVGPSGCGKTTILSVVSGLIKATAGSIILDGVEVKKAGMGTGYMLQRDQLFEWRTIEKNVLLGLEIQKKVTYETKQYALGLIEKYGLKEFKKHFPNQLSGGMRQRAALIRTLALKPKLLLLDEPFSALDYQTRLNLCDDVYKIIKAERTTSILVTHDISEAVSLADRIIVLSNRPANVKNIYTINIDSPTPLSRRKDSKFAGLFDRIWKEVSI